MKDIKAIKGKYYIHNLISEGEHEHQDFKFAITDASKIAHSISAFANNDGGRLLIGVKDNGNIAGVRNEEDIYMIEQAAQMYCKPPQEVKVTAFNVENGLIVIRAEIMKAQKRPVFAREADGKWRAYYRVKDENITAPKIMVEAWHRMSDCDGEIFSLSETEITLLRYVDECGHTSVEDYMHGAHVSRSAAEETIVRLVAMGVLEFAYTGSEFKIVRVG